MHVLSFMPSCPTINIRAFMIRFDFILSSCLDFVSSGLAVFLILFAQVHVSSVDWSIAVLSITQFACLCIAIYLTWLILQSTNLFLTRSLTPFQSHHRNCAAHIRSHCSKLIKFITSPSPKKTWKNVYLNKKMYCLLLICVWFYM